MCRWISMEKSMEDLTSVPFWRAVLAELFGTGFLVFFAAGTSMGWSDPDPTVVQMSLASGLAVATIISCIGPVSGGHINPAVTLPMLISRRISFAKAILYIIAQVVGGIGAAGLLYALTSEPIRGKNGMTVVNSNVSGGQAFGVEFIITFVLVFTVYAVLDENRPAHGGSAPLAIGLSVALGHLVGIRYSGASMNSARSFGPAFIHNDWDKHWVYWIGPNLGGVTAGFIYDYAFAATASYSKAKSFFLKQKAPSTKSTDDTLNQPLKFDEIVESSYN